MTSEGNLGSLRFPLRSKQAGVVCVWAVSQGPAPQWCLNRACNQSLLALPCEGLRAGLMGVQRPRAGVSGSSVLSFSRDGGVTTLGSSDHRPQRPVTPAALGENQTVCACDGHLCWRLRRQQLGTSQRVLVGQTFHAHQEKPRQCQLA